MQYLNASAQKGNKDTEIQQNNSDHVSEIKRKHTPRVIPSMILNNINIIIYGITDIP